MQRCIIQPRKQAWLLQTMDKVTKMSQCYQSLSLLVKLSVQSYQLSTVIFYTPLIWIINYDNSPEDDQKFELFFL